MAAPSIHRPRREGHAGGFSRDRLAIPFGGHAATLAQPAARTEGPTAHRSRALAASPRPASTAVRLAGNYERRRADEHACVSINCRPWYRADAGPAGRGRGDRLTNLRR